MKIVIVGVLVAVLIISGLLVGCWDVVMGSGNLKTENYNFSDFNRIEVGGAFEVEVVQSSTYSISVTTDDNLFKYANISKVGETLKIGLKAIKILGPVTLKAEITMPQLRHLAGERLHHVRMAVAKRVDRNAGDEVQIAATIGGVEIGTFPPLEGYVGANIVRHDGVDHGALLIGSGAVQRTPGLAENRRVSAPCPGMSTR